jgi:hypothetical protein
MVGSSSEPAIQVTERDGVHMEAEVGRAGREDITLLNMLLSHMERTGLELPRGS